MKKMKAMVNNLYFRGITSWNCFKSSERGDTNFISILLIIAIVVVLAGAFLALGNQVMSTVSQKIMDFLNNL